MKNFILIFIKLIIVLVGILAVVFLLWEPHIEGRNINSTLLKIYFNDPFLIYAYLSSCTFFVALYQSYTLISYFQVDKIISIEALNAVRKIKLCAYILFILVVIPLAYLFIARSGDDIAGGVFIGILFILFSMVLASISVIMEKKLQSLINKKLIN